MNVKQRILAGGAVALTMGTIVGGMALTSSAIASPAPELEGAVEIQMIVENSKGEWISCATEGIVMPTDEALGELEAAYSVSVGDDGRVVAPDGGDAMIQEVPPELIAEEGVVTEDGPVGGSGAVVAPMPEDVREGSEQECEQLDASLPSAAPGEPAELRVVGRATADDSTQR